MTILILRGLIDLWAVPSFFSTVRSRGLVRSHAANGGAIPGGARATALDPALYGRAVCRGAASDLLRRLQARVSGQFRREDRAEPEDGSLDSELAGAVDVLPRHLRFLRFLLFVSIGVLPLLVYLRSASGKRMIARVARWGHHRGRVFLLALPIIAVRIALMASSSGSTLGQLLRSTRSSVIGYMLMAGGSFADSIRRHGGGARRGDPWVGRPGILRSPARVSDVRHAVLDRVRRVPDPHGDRHLGSIVFLFSLTARHLDRPSSLLPCANEAVLPIYIFHQTVILGIGWFVIQWNLSVWAKAIIVVVAAFAATLLLYDVFVRQSDVMRFFFGMRPKRS